MLEFHHSSQYQAKLDVCTDARTGVPSGLPEGAMCVQRFDDSLNSAIHITYRISLRSSSMPEPRDPLLKVLIYLFVYIRQNIMFNLSLVFEKSCHYKKKYNNNLLLISNQGDSEMMCG